MRDLFNNLEMRRCLSPVDGGDNTALVSQIIDLVNREGVVFAIATGVLADAGATWTVLVEDGNDSGLSDAAAVDDAFLLGTEALASFIQSDDNKVFKIGYIGPKRYVRLTVTPAGNAGSDPIAIVAILGFPRVSPQSSQS